MRLPCSFIGIVTFILFFHLSVNGQNQVVFNYTGAIQSWTVPAGVTSITVKLWGAGGAGSNCSSNCGSGGSGAFVKGDLAVTPGQTYYIVVGGRGEEDNTCTYCFAYGGGGGGYYQGGNGGGYSGIFSSSSITQANAKAIAGGGGGGGYYSKATYGGAGGALNGSNGGNYSGTYTGGFGGTTSAGGGGGLWNNSQDGGPGSALKGGNGWYSNNSDYDGGGGGGGYYGGGGGYGSSNSTYYSSGGGGGSSYIGGLTNVTNTAGTIKSDGTTAQAPGSTEKGYTTGIGNGGAINSNGGYGKVVINICQGLGEETNPLFVAAEGCKSGSVSIGSGAYYDLTISKNTYYEFKWTDGGSYTDGFCAQVQNGNGSDFTSDQNHWFSGTTDKIRINALRTTWGTTSAVLTYTATPSLSLSSNKDPSFCPGGDITFSTTTNLTAETTNYTWSPATNLNSTTSPSVTASPSNSITYTVNPSPDCSAPPTNGLIAWYPLDEDASDVIGAHNGTITGAVLDNAHNLKGYQFSANGQKITIPNDAAFNPVFGSGNNFTISAWAKPTAWTDYSSIVTKANGDSWSNSTSGIWSYSGGFVVVLGSNVDSNPAGSYFNIVYKPSLNVWHHVVMVADGTNIIMYVDGGEVGRKAISTVTNPRTTNNLPITIGGARQNSGTNGHFPGIIDDVKMYNRGLSAAEVKALYRSPSVRVRMKNIEVTTNATPPSVPSPSYYKTLKEAFDDINAGKHKDAITVKVNCDATDNATATLNASGTGSASYTSVNMYPTANATLSGNINGNLIQLNGADNVTIDGRLNGNGTSKSLTIQNTNTSTGAGNSAIRLINGAQNNTIRDITVKASSGANNSSNGGAIISIHSAKDATPAGGNSNNTITNCDITSSTATRSLVGILSYTATGTNENNTISNNNIFDTWRPAATSYSILMNTGSKAAAITGNSIYETTAYTPTLAGTHRAIQITTAGLGGHTISGNYIGGKSPLCGGSALSMNGTTNLYGIYVTATDDAQVSSMQGNTIANLDITTANTVVFRGIALDAAAGSWNIGTITGNTVGSASGTGNIKITSAHTAAATSYGILVNSTGTLDVRNNTVASVTVSTADFPLHFYALYRNSGVGTSTNISNNFIGSDTPKSIQCTSVSATAQNIYGITSATASPVTINNNVVNNLYHGYTGAGNGMLKGIYVSTDTVDVTNNTVSNLSSTTPNTQLTTSAPVMGMDYRGTGGTVSGNTIFNIKAEPGTTANAAIGLMFNSTATSNIIVENNFIHSLSNTSTSTTAEVRGIFVAKTNSTTPTFANNIINVGASITTQKVIYGIYDAGSANNHANYYHNTVYVGGSTSGTALTYAFYSNGTANTKNIRNNIFHNARTNSTANQNFAIRLAGTTNITLDYNTYAATGTGGVLSRIGSTNYADFNAWKTATTQDAHSYNLEPDYMTKPPTTSAAHYDLNCGQDGINGLLSKDYANTNRANPPTIGAYEAPIVKVTMDDLTETVCNGTEVTLSGTVTASGAWTINLSDNSTVTGTGNQNWSKVVIPTSSTNYTIDDLTSGTCTTSGDGSSDITLPQKGTALSTTGTESATCPVKGNSPVHFYNTTSPYHYIGSINPNGKDLGDVTMTSYVGTPKTMVSCDDPNNPTFITAYMGRNWAISSTAYPNHASFGGNVTVTLPFGDAELTALNTAATSLTPSNSKDDGADLTNMMLTKISGTSVNGEISEVDCSTGATIIGIDAIAQSGNNIQQINGTKYLSFNVGEFSDFFLHKNNALTGSPLPITLESFSGNCDNGVELTWVTGSENNVSHYEIYSSTDGSVWNKETEVTANGNSSTELVYTTNVRTVDAIAYYRLRSVDNDGQFEDFSPMSIACDRSENTWNLYPVPAIEQVTVTIQTDKPIKDQIILMDMNGRIVESHNINLEAGIHNINLNINTLSKGTYTVKMANQTDYKPLRVVKVQ